MGNKNILIFEAFNSKTLSKTVKFLDKEVGKEARYKFTKSLIHIGGMYDFTISDINDEYFDYLNKKDALKVRNDKDVDNKYGIYCLKFWFSIDKGYIGYTYTGNIKKNRNKSGLSNSELSELSISSGKLIELSDDNIDDLETGDIVVGYLSNNEDMDKLVRSTVYREGRYIYVIQDVTQGNSPDDNNWKKYGMYSYAIGQRGNLESDNYKLHKYIDDNTPLVEDNEIDVMSFNLPMKGDEVKSWTQIYRSIDIDGIDKSDFSIIFHFNDFTSLSNKSLSKLKDERIESRKGASKLLSDDEVRAENIERYINEISKKFGIDNDNVDPKNLEKIILKMLGSFSLYRMNLDFVKDNISKLIDNLSSLMDTYDEYILYHSRGFNVEHLTDRIKLLSDKVKNIINIIYNDKSNIRATNKVNEIINKLKASGLTEEVKIVNKLLSLSSLFNSKLLSNPINTVDDIIIIKYKMEMISKIINSERVGLSHNVKSFLDNIKYDDYDSFNAIKNISDAGYDKAWDRINKLEVQINKL